MVYLCWFGDGHYIIYPKEDENYNNPLKITEYPVLPARIKGVKVSFITKEESDKLEYLISPIFKTYSEAQEWMRLLKNMGPFLLGSNTYRIRHAYFSTDINGQSFPVNPKNEYCLLL